MGFEFQFFLEIGTLMFLAFIGVLLTKKFGQSVLLAYILIGIVIGHNGLKIIDTIPAPLDFGNKNMGMNEFSGGLIYILSQFGLVLLLFFVGLEFSLSKLKRTRKPAVILATFDVAVNIFVGVLIGTYFGWPIIDSIFLACIIAMSSVAVTIKILEELKRANKPETEILISLMIVEDFASIILLTAVSSFVIGSKATALSVFWVFAGIIALFAFFTVLSFVFIPTILRKIERVEKGEYFIFMALGIVCLSAALAEFLGVAAIVGAFLIGMGFAETKIAGQLKSELMTFKNAFVAIFFISFGMLIDPAVFSEVGHLIILAVPLTIFNEIILVAIVAFIIGLSAEAAISVGAGALGRSEEAIIFANVGTGLKTSEGTYVLSQTGRNALAPFAGGFCLIMSSITPFFMKSSYKIANFFRKTLPAHLKFCGRLLSRMLKGMVFGSAMAREKRDSSLTVALSAYFILMLSLIFSEGISPATKFLGYSVSLLLLIALSVMVMASVFIIWHLISIRMRAIVANMELGKIPLNHEGRMEAVSYANGFITGSLFTFIIMALVWNASWKYTIISMIIYLAIIWAASYYIYNRLVGDLQWIAREEIRESRTQKPVIISKRPKTFTYRGESWEHQNPKFRKKK